MDSQSKILDIQIPHLLWKPVSLTLKGKPFQWHLQRPPRVRARDQIDGPKVYRWTMANSSGEIYCSYIGETQDFRQRLAEYRTNGATRQHAAVKEAMRQCVHDGGTVELWFLDLGTFSLRINGELLPKRTLADHDVRLMMENFAILTARVQGMKLLNHDRGNVFMKNMSRLEMQHPGHPEIGLMKETLAVLLQNS